MTTTDTRTAGGVIDRLRATRRLTESLAAALTPEDQVVQSMADVSPTKWHRAHTTWFFETFVLTPHLAGYRPVHPAYDYLFNSYYEQVGDRHPRAERGLISRPTGEEVAEYRAAVDQALDELIDGADGELLAAILPLLELGTNHEEQHQELLLMDIKHVFSCNPMRPVYRLGTAPLSGPPVEDVRWIEVDAGRIEEIGARGDGFSFDNEGPRHQALIHPFRLADRLATEGDWLAFIADGGYQRPELWLSEGWATVKAQGWEAPLYWDRDGDSWSVFTLGGTRPVLAATPVVHVSYFEADAFARWSGTRLATEAEWEVAAALVGAHDAPNDLGAGALHPRPAAPGSAGQGVRQLFGDGWEWTASPYGPYPGFRPVDGAIGEYNGKFMCNQMVLRGGAAVTPSGHTRATYRNFFPASARWAFSTVRLADDVAAPPKVHHRHVLAAQPASVPSVIPPVIDVHLGAADLGRALRADVVAGLAAAEPSLPPKWFYDDRGSELFDQITRLDEYYPTRREREILQREAAAIAEASGADTLVELGSGTSDKTRLLLDAFDATGQLQRFVPFDVSEGILRWSAHTIAERHPGVAVHGVVGDFDHHLGCIPAGGRRMVAFLGGTIGNYEPGPRARLLAGLAATLASGDSLLLGTDLVKDPQRLVLAYDDPAGVTAEFNRNVLRVLARELDAEVDPDSWEHVARWDAGEEWIEMRLAALGPQRIAVPSLGVERSFGPGESLRTEVSAKFRRETVEAELAAAGLELTHWWTDAAGDFALSLSTKP
ncbi:ergothioneine biosynthesis protein EgtB [Aquihabitans sp. McL0605]|uniref:ergothioneine biosynthesis protein EgtB n=1 Tax=Aquihabitans sp. McL0605 TaxID=3415671 RepID=UPI003CEF0A82